MTDYPIDEQDDLLSFREELRRPSHTTTSRRVYLVTFVVFRTIRLVVWDAPKFLCKNIEAISFSFFFLTVAAVAIFLAYLAILVLTGN